MTLHRVTDGKHDLCAWCFRKDLRLARIYVPYRCWRCGEIPGNGDQKQICNECLTKIEGEHTVEMHNSVDLI